MKHNLFIKLAAVIVFIAAVVSLPAAPGASPAAAQEPTPTGDVSGQIVGGAPADPGEWPWQVALIDGSASEFYYSQFCGGSLIAPQWVLTAGHCVYGDNPADVDIVAGIYNLATPASGYQRRDVTQIIIHPSYVNNPPFNNDIALLRLASPVTLGGSGATKTAVVPLVAASIGSLAGTNSWVTGWGNTESVPAYPNELHEVQLPIITNTLCQQTYGGAITADMLCAGYAQGGKDSCQGDSGGPLVVSVNGQWQLAGIVSWGDGCADPGYYGVYTRVSNFVNWVDDYVAPELTVNSINIYPPDIIVDPNIYHNDDISIYIEVQNISGVDSGPFTGNIYVDNHYTACSSVNRSYHMDSPGLAGGAKDLWQITIPAGTLSLGDHTIRVYLDSTCAIAEDDESNNIASATFTINAVPVAPPSHDSVSTPKTISSLPYTDSGVDVRGATRHPSDPTDIGCPAPDHMLDAGLASVWYQYTPASNTTVYLDTFGSNYDTYIAVWQGTPGTTLVGCNDDFASGNLQSRLSVSLISGNTYYFQVAQYSNDITNVSANSLGKSSSDIGSQAGGSLTFVVSDRSVFEDVPDNHWARQYIEALYFNGYTAGCSATPLLYCPETIMSRVESAVFILRGEFGSSYTPPPPPWGRFKDDWSAGPWGEKWAEGLYNAGLTAGCGTNPLRFCPWDKTPRMQLAVFATRLRHGSSFFPPNATGTVFADITDPNAWYARWAEQAYADGLIPACGMQGGKPLFCPNQLVTRALAAYAIVQAKGLLP